MNEELNELKAKYNPAEGDGLLRSIAHMANMGHLSTEITLYMHGTIITGVLVGQEEYFNGVADELEASANPLSQDAEEFLKGLIKTYRDIAATKKEEREARFAIVNSQPEGTAPLPEVPRMIHLRNAKAHSTRANETISWWRGRISSIDAFNLGAYR